MKFRHLVIGTALLSVLTPSAFAVTATGGNTTNDIDGYRIYTFTNSAQAGDFVISAGGFVDVLVVAGGGGGGETIGGGGGGGGVIYSNAYPVIAGIYTVIVGQGGMGGSGSIGYPPGAKGDNSVFGFLTAIGGGAGAGHTGAAVGIGGSAGGNGGAGGARAEYTPDQGNDGGTQWGINAGGGGGGAGEKGGDGTADSGGKGGDGRAFAISGVMTCYGGGGGGGTRDVTGPDAGAGGMGGGGHGGRFTVGEQGLDLTGGGGGGGGYVAKLAGGTGGGGIVIVRYSLIHPGIENAIATNIAFTGAWLNGTLSSTGASPTAVFAYWGPTDGGTSASDWANTNAWASPQAPGAFTIQSSDLSINSTYYYRFAASNTAGWSWAPETSALITGEVRIEKTADASEIGPTPGTFTVHRAAAATNAALLVNYTVGGTAVNGTDYEALSGTVTIPKGEASATIEVLPFFEHVVEGLETVVVTLVPGLYMIGSSSEATVEIEDYGLAFTRTWSGNGANAFASNPTNWMESEAPITGDTIILDSRTAKNMTWDLNVPVQSWTQDGYMGTVTIATVYPNQGTFTNFIVLGDCIVSNGLWTQTANPTTVTKVNNEKYRLRVTVGGNLSVGANGSIDVTGMGYMAGKGPGAPVGNGCASYGGVGNSDNGAGLGPCYGSITAPINLGSGGRGGGDWPGGGAVWLTVGGEARVDGAIRAESPSQNNRMGSGGSICVRAGSLKGSGTISANGGSAWGSGGGGRVALVVTNSDENFSGFIGCVTAYGGVGSSLGPASAGTVYFETSADSPNCGALRIDNRSKLTSRSLFADLNGVEPVTYEFSRIVLTNAGVLAIGSDDTLIATNTIFEGDATNINEGIVINGGMLRVPAAFAFSSYFIRINAPHSTFSPGTSLTVGTNAALIVDQPHATQGDLIVEPGGLLTQSDNPDGNTEVYKVKLSVQGAMTVQAGGRVDVTAKGFRAGYGPGTPVSGNGGGSYGGLGSESANPGPCYGSIVAPTNLGSGGAGNTAWPGGGAVLLSIEDALRVDGVIVAESPNLTHRPGSGGSINIMAGALRGAGMISANGGGGGGSGHAAGGGGRVAVAVTKTDEDFSLFTGAIQAYGGAANVYKNVGAGTVYLRTAGQGLYEGTLIVDNSNRNTRATQINSDVTDTIVGDVLIRNKAYLLLATNQTLTVGGIWSNGADFAAQWGSQIILSGGSGSTSTLYGANVFMGLVCTNGGKTILFQDGKTNVIAAQGRLILKGTSASDLILRSTTPTAAWKLNVDAAAEQVIENVDVADSDASGGVQVTALNSVNTGSNSNWDFQSVSPGDTIMWSGGTSAVWSARGNWNLDRAPTEKDTIVIPTGKPRYPVMDADRTVNALSIEVGASLELAGLNLTVTNNLTLAGTFIASGTETVTLWKDADFTGGTVESALSSFVLAGDVAQSVNMGGLRFYTVQIDNSAAIVTLLGGFTATELRCEAPSGARSLSFEAGKTVTLRDLVLRGATPSATNILLRSTADGQKWKLAVSGYRSVRGVNVKDSDASGGLPIPAVASENGGGNTNWMFGVVPSEWLGASGNNFHTAANWNPAVVPDAATRVLVEGANPLTMTGTVSILDLTVGGGAGAASVTVDGSLTVGESVSVLDNGTLTWNRPGVVSNDLIVASGGSLTHTGNSSTEVNKLNLTVGGSVGVDVGGLVDVTGKGYATGQGPGTAGSGAQVAGSSHGGRGAVYLGKTPGLCYGSIVAPGNFGSGGGYSAGGGAIIVLATGTIRNDGLLCADGAPYSHYQGSGGTVFLTAGALTGIGTIRANGGDMTGGAAAAGGGRVSLVVTHLGSDFSGYSGVVQARGSVLLPAGVNAGGAGAGTVYRQTATDLPGRGTVTVDNDNLTSSGYAVMPPYTNYLPGEVDRAVFRVVNAATLTLTNDFTVGDIWLDTANAWLDLGSNTLTVKARQHALTPGTVINCGKIVWTGLPPGVLIIVK